MSSITATDEELNAGDNWITEIQKRFYEIRNRLNLLELSVNEGEEKEAQEWILKLVCGFSEINCKIDSYAANATATDAPTRQRYADTKITTSKI